MNMQKRKSEREQEGRKERKRKNEKERKEGSKGRKKGAGGKKEGQKQNLKSDQYYGRKKSREQRQLRVCDYSFALLKGVGMIVEA